MPRKKKTSKRPASVKPRVALCYVRQSYTRDEDDMNSPERQRANITRVCERHDWIPEWYEDVGGHKSGRDVENRPEWLKLRSRLGDPDIVALVANDLSRLHRNVARISSLIETLEESEIALILAASDISIDTSTIMGQMFAQFSGLMDAYYAKDISLKAKDSIEHRKRQGKTVGIPPFGTTRNDEGYLIPSPEGAWLLPDGRFVAGDMSDPPMAEAVWRGYHACAERMLTIYAENKLGLERIAYQMNSEGWAFQDRKGRPRPIARADVRRVVANWPEYGGIVLGQKSKDRPAYEDYNVDDMPFVKERAVFSIELLKRVGTVRKKRTTRPKNHGVNRTTYPYVLNGITYCAHCEQLAEKHQNPRLRTRLGGSRSRNKRRYRHKAGVKCGVHNRSVPCEELDADFGRLIKLLSVDEAAIELMIEFAIQADKANGVDDQADPEEEKRKAIALCKRRIEAAQDLYINGRLAKEKYWKIVEDNEREIAHWETRTTETEKAALQLALCIDLINNIADTWEMGEDEDRKRLAENLFTELVYDLDSRRIVSFKLKPLYDRFLVLRADWHDAQAATTDHEGKEAHEDIVTAEDSEVSEGVQQDMMKRPLGGISCQNALTAPKTTFELSSIGSQNIIFTAKADGD